MAWFLNATRANAALLRNPPSLLDGKGFPAVGLVKVAVCQAGLLLTLAGNVSSPTQACPTHGHPRSNWLASSHVYDVELGRCERRIEWERSQSGDPSRFILSLDLGGAMRGPKKKCPERMAITLQEVIHAVHGDSAMN